MGFHRGRKQTRQEGVKLLSSLDRGRSDSCLHQLTLLSGKSIDRSQKLFRRSSPFIVSIPVTAQRDAEAAKHCCPGWTRFPCALIFFSTELKTMLPLLREMRMIINLEQV